MTKTNKGSIYYGVIDGMNYAVEKYMLSRIFLDSRSLSNFILSTYMY